MTGRPGGSGDSFTALEQQMDELEGQGVPDEWTAAFRRLRSELKNVRGRWSPYEQAFGRLHEEDADQFLQAAAAWADGNTEPVGRWMLDIAKHVAGEQFPEWVGAEQGDPSLTDPGETPDNQEGQDEMGEITEETLRATVAEAVAAALVERDEKSAEERRTTEFREQVNSKLKELGYEDPSSPEAAAVLLRAKDMDGDPFESITAAHEQFQTFILERAKQYAADKSADAGATDPLVGEANGETDPLETGHTVDASESDPEVLMRNRLDAVFGDGDTSVLT